MRSVVHKANRLFSAVRPQTVNLSQLIDPIKGSFFGILGGLENNSDKYTSVLN